jgi:hypothetical protein
MEEEVKKPRGGHRPNSGRKPEGKKQISIRLSPPDIATLKGKYGTVQEAVNSLVKKKNPRK